MSNIFDLSARQNPKPRPKPKKTVEKVPETANQTTETPSEKKATSQSQADIQNLLNQMREGCQEIDSKLQDLYTKAGLSPRQLKELVAKLRQSGRTEVQEVLDKKKVLEEKVFAALGKDAKELKSRKENEESSKQRKAKSIGARRGWISTK